MLCAEEGESTHCFTILVYKGRSVLWCIMCDDYVGIGGDVEYIGGWILVKMVVVVAE